MAITDSQKVDYLLKKIGYGVAKTDTLTSKSPANESIASPLLLRGENIWQQSGTISSVSVLPTANTSVVSIYRDTLSSTIQTTNDGTAATNRTWKTNLTDWIGPEFGSGYAVKVYTGASGNASPQSLTALPSDGSGNNDSWYFDYQSGVLNFADTNVPTAVTGNVIYISGARYTGQKGISNFPGGLTMGNITINGNAVTSSSGNLYVGNSLIVFNIGDVSANIGALYSNATTQQTSIDSINANLGAFEIYANANAASQAQSINTINANLGAFETYANANFVIAATEYGNTQVAAYLPLYTGNLSPGNVTSTFYGNVHADYIFPKTSDVVAFSGAKAITLPTGGNTARPSTPTIGAFRYNSDLSTLEFYNSSGWIPLSNSIESQDFYGDGINKTFTLTYATTAVGILVSINGTVQQPGLAYTVSGTQITFVEVPLTTDLIDIRYLASAVSVSINNEVIDSTPQNVNTVATIVDSWDSTLYCVAKYMVSGTIGSTGHSSEINLLQNAGQTAITAQAVLNIGSDTISYSANINGTTVNLLAIGTVAGNIRLQRTLFNI